MKPTYALICFYDDKNQILLQSRKSINKWNSEWGFFGGHIEEGESNIQAALREAKEEIDLDLNEEDLTFIGTFKSPVSPYYSSIFLCKLPIPIEEITVLEGDGCKLLTEEESLKLDLHPGDIFRTSLVFKFLRLMK